MNFIRTEDGHIFPLKDKTMTEYLYQENGDFKSSKIIKRADTIEELCDELVFEWHRSSISHDNDVWHLYHKISLKEEVENALTDGYRANIEQVKNIYGAIWTDKGLIYVAKMNEKGDLKLL